MRLRHQEQPDEDDPAQAAPVPVPSAASEIDETPLPPIEDDRPRGRRLIARAAEAFRLHRQPAIAAAVAVLVAAILLYALTPRRYAAYADVWLDHAFGESGAKDEAAQRALSRNTEIRVLSSTDRAAAVVDRLGLANVRGIGQPADGPTIDSATGRATAIAAVRDNLTIAADGRSYAIKARYVARDPVLATAVLNRLVDDYVEDRRTGGVKGRQREALRAEALAVRDTMIRDAATVDGFRAATDLTDKPGARARLEKELTTLDGELAATRAAQDTALGQLTRAGWSRNAQGRGTTARIRDLQAHQFRLLAERAAATAARIDTAATDAALGETGRAIDGEVRRTNQLVSAVHEARAHATLIEAVRARGADELRTSDAAREQLARLDERAAAARGHYSTLVTQYNGLIAAQRNQRGSAYVIAHAQVPSTRGTPNPLTFLLGGLAAAILAAAALVTTLELLVKGFRTRRHFEQTLDIPVIGMVPDLAKVPGADVPADDPMAPPDYLYDNPRSSFSAAFRGIHTGLRLGRGAHSPRSIAVSSALPEEGKTTVAICLARSAAMAGLRVVLVDCDARRPAASRALSPYVDVGLAEVLEDRVHFRKAIQCDTPSGAWFLAHGTDRAVANGMIRPEALEDLLGALVREFDLVVLDTPPALALVEAREVAALADRVLLVARSRRTPVDATRLAKEQLTQAGAKIAAAALTRVDP